LSYGACDPGKPRKGNQIVLQFAKRNLHFGGITVPAIQIGPDETVQIALANGKTRFATFADMISLREANPDGPNAGTTYLQLSRENKGFTTLRFDHVVGLDVDADGTFLSIEDLETRRAAQITLNQQARAANRALATVELPED